MSDLVDALRRILPADRVDDGVSARDARARGESYDRAVLPEVVVHPTSTEEVAAVVRLAAETRTPVTPVAVNSSLEGQTVPLHGGISLDFTRMDRILEIAAEDAIAVVQPGVTYPRLNEALRHTGLFFPVDPGAEASLGGMASTNASGTMAVRYGVTADRVSALEVVTARGEVIRTGGRSRKSSSGYALTRLLCGSEGTLGLFTELTLRLAPRPESVVGARASFPSVHDAVAFVTETIQAGAPVARCELVDRPSLGAIREQFGLDLPDAPTVFLEFHGAPQATIAGADEALAAAREHRALAAGNATDPDALRALWEARHKAYLAMVARHPGMANLLTDLAVPVSRLAQVIDASVEAVATLELPAYVLGHVGDGNFHMAIFFDPDDEEARTRSYAAHDRLVELALAAGGTCTGEHGIGVRKLPYVRREHGAAVDWMWAIKDAFDPDGILNPGKKLPPR